MTSRLALRVSACLASLLWAACAWGATMDIVGFETGDASFTANSDGECSTVFGTYELSTTTVRSGAYALRINIGATTSTGYAVLTMFSATGAHVNSSNIQASRFYFRYATKPGSGTEEIFASGNFVLRLNSTGNILAYNFATLLGTGSTTLNANTWYRINVKNNGTNAWAVAIDGASELSGTDAVNRSTSGNFGKVTNRSTQAVDFFYDDIITSDTYEDIGPGKIVRLAPTANGTYTAWTDGDGDATGNYTDVDDAPGDPAYDSLTSYVLTTTNTAAETVNVTDSSAAGISGTINAIKSITVHRRNDASTTNVQHRLVSNGTDYDLTSVSTTNGTWRLLASVRSVDPFDSGAWSTSDIDGLQVGVEHNTATARELDFTMACIMVDFQPSTGNAMPEASTIYRRRRVDLDELPNPAPGGPIRGR